MFIAPMAPSTGLVFKVWMFALVLMLLKWSGLSFVNSFRLEGFRF